MSSDSLEIAKKLSLRPYLVMYAKSETTDGQPIYNARTLEIDGCIGQGDTPEDAIQDLRDALIDYIEDLLEDGLEVPEPIQLVRTEGARTTTTIKLSNRHETKDAQQRQVQDPMLLSRANA